MPRLTYYTRGGVADLHHVAASMSSTAKALREEADQLDADAAALYALLAAEATVKSIVPPSEPDA